MAVLRMTRLRPDTLPKPVLSGTIEASLQPKGHSRMRYGFGHVRWMRPTHMPLPAEINRTGWSVAPRLWISESSYFRLVDKEQVKSNGFLRFLMKKPVSFAFLTGCSSVDKLWITCACSVYKNRPALKRGSVFINRDSDTATVLSGRLHSECACASAGSSA